MVANWMRGVGPSYERRGGDLNEFGNKQSAKHRRCSPLEGTWRGLIKSGERGGKWSHGQGALLGRGKISKKLHSIPNPAVVKKRELGGKKGLGRKGGGRLNIATALEKVRRATFPGGVKAGPGSLTCVHVTRQIR